jgi:predicted acylesterase/phospholipase RssA
MTDLNAGVAEKVEPTMRGDAPGVKSPARVGGRTRAKGRGAVRTRRSGPLDLNGKRVVLLLQGGGALGAYQVGAYEALAAELRRIGKDNVDWVGGISIGAVNSAVIAGPKCGDATKELHALWDDLVLSELWDFTAPWGWGRKVASGWADAKSAASWWIDKRPAGSLWKKAASALSRFTDLAHEPWPWLRAYANAVPWIGAVAPPWPFQRLFGKWWNWVRVGFHPLGLGNFFWSKVSIPPLNPWFEQWVCSVPLSQLAFYPTGPLRRTLERHVDFDVINGKGKPKGPRISLGAARVTTGEVVFFENAPLEDEDGTPVGAAGDQIFRIFRPDHVLASGALPPAFPPIRIEDPGFDDGARSAADTWYWDGGVSSNTPIQWLIEDLLPNAEEREQDGRYEKGTIVFLIDVWDRKGPLPKSMDEACWRQKSIEFGSLKDAARNAVREERARRREERRRRHAEGIAETREREPRLEICQIMYERSDDEGPQFAFADADFSRATYDTMREQGEKDMTAALNGPFEVEVDDLAGNVVLYRFGTHGKHLWTD